MKYVSELEARIIVLEECMAKILKHFYGADYHKIYKDTIEQAEKESKNV